MDLMQACKVDVRGLSSYSLNSVAEKVLNEKKDDVHWTEMYGLFTGNQELRNIFVNYCFKDVILPSRIENRRNILEKQFGMSRVSGTTISRLLNKGQTEKVRSLFLRYARKQGYIVLNGTHWIERPTYQVNAIDTTGCGDLFHAGVTLGLLRGWELEKTLDFSAWAAAAVSTKLGGRDGIPSISDFYYQENNHSE